MATDVRWAGNMLSDVKRVHSSKKFSGGSIGLNVHMKIKIKRLAKFKTTADKTSENSFMKMAYCLGRRYTVTHRTGFVSLVLNIMTSKLE